jgi:hypothetical protein
MNIKIISWCFCLSLTAIIQSATITLTFRPYPNVKEALEHLKKPEKLAHHMLVRITERAPIIGIVGTYAGYIQTSNENGEMIFPRKQTSTQLFLLITPEITPILMFPHTVKEWELVPNKPYAYFSVNRVTDLETELTYWDVAEAQLDPARPLHLETIILIANPQDLVVPTGITLTNSSTNLQLPTIYSQNSLDTSLAAVTMMNVAYLFNPATQCEVKKDKYFAEQPCVP